MVELFEKIKRKLIGIVYSIPFGMKGAEDEIFSNPSVGSNGTQISQEVSDKRVANHLLKGEVTQEVEELRYRTYKVASESENFEYLGGGVCVRKDGEIVPSNPSKLRFVQSNELLCSSILDELNHVGDYGTEDYRFEIMYEGFPRFKVEKYAKNALVIIDDVNKVIRTEFRFSMYADKYEFASKAFLKQLEELYNVTESGVAISDWYLNRNEISSIPIASLSFTTYKANGEDDLVNYSFVGAKYAGISKTDEGDYSVAFEWESYIRMPMDLVAKYYSKEMDEKYKKKERKDVDVSIVNQERKRYCSLCGKEVSVYDGDIMEYNGDEVLCKECLEKISKANNTTDDNRN